ncbi:MAG: phosphate acyltransferase PlsX [Acidobacteria bacterium]|nr:phosphate acyltransferase PlsX [Acidobacteriota bacterium]
MTGTATQPPRVAVDALGGDHGPRVVVEGAAAACRELGVRVLLVGPRAIVVEEVRRAGAEGLSLEVVDAPEAVDMAEKVTKATLKKRSSIHLATELVRDGGADAFFSAGNTAACWTIARMVLGTLEEVDRPALAAVVPNVAGRTVLLDVGANASCKARHLEEFAVMGSIYTRAVLHVPNPRVGLMSMGEEETKGNELVKEVHEVLKASALNFVGNVEGHDVFNGRADVIVMDGFTGNVVLKTSESLAESMMHLLKEELTRTRLRLVGAWLSRGAFEAVKRRTDASEYGGAPLLGVKGCCVIGHGRSNATAIKHGIRVAAEFFASGVNERIESELRALGARKEATPSV